MHTMDKDCCSHQETGFSLIEVMVAMVISMIMTLVVLKVFMHFETNNRITSTGINAHQNGQIAIHILHQELRQAGYGLMIDDLQDCNTFFTYYDTAGGTANNPVVNFSTTAVTIIDGGANSDQILVRYGDSLRIQEPVILDTNFTRTDDDFSVDSVFGLSAGELILVVNDANDCTLRKITSINTGSTNIEADVNTPPYNPPVTQINSIPWPDYVVGDRVYSLGNMVARNYVVNGTSLTAQNLDEANAIVLVDDIVDLQAQYGISASATSTTVTEWVDATGAIWLAPTVANRKRIKAIRLAVIARTAVSESVNVSPATIKLWPDIIAPPGQVTTGPVYNVPDRRYRYKVLQTVVPLRNLLSASLS